MSRFKELWDTYGQMSINNERALEVVRMVRELYPHEASEPGSYDFWTVLGIVQETLECNEKLFVEHEKTLVMLTESSEVQG